MANAILQVTVNGGTVPLDIQASLFKGVDLVETITKPRSFTKRYNSLGNGKYTLYVHGFNPAGGGSTTFDLTGTDITITRPTSIPFTKIGVGYTAEFRFTVG